MPFMPTEVLFQNPDTSEAWAVFRTAPHVAWHADGWYETESDAWTAAGLLLDGGWADAVVVRHVRFLSCDRVPASGGRPGLHPRRGRIRSLIDSALSPRGKKEE